MTTIQNLIDHYSEIVAILQREKITKAILFKGFGSKEEHNFNLFLEYTNDDTETTTTRSSRVTRDLQQLLGCEICPCNAAKMDPDYADKLNALNSVTLLEKGSSCDNISQELVQAFGLTWELNEALQLAAAPSMEGYEQHAEEMERYRQQIADEEKAEIAKETQEVPQSNVGQLFAAVSKKDPGSRQLEVKATLDNGVVLMDIILSLRQLDPKTLQSDNFQRDLGSAITSLIESYSAKFTIK